MTETTDLDKIIKETHARALSEKTLIWKGYEQALNGLSCRNMDGELMEPEIALVKFKDGWRQFARHTGIEGVSTTSWSVDPHEVIVNANRI